MEESCVSFFTLSLDDRLLKGISKLGWPNATNVQGKVIPPALEGKDIVARAKTGSGKTAAYLIPAIQKIIESKTRGTNGLSCLVLLPSKELCKQAYGHMISLTAYCSKDVGGLDIGNKTVDNVKPLLSKDPDIIFTTPGKLLANVNHKTLKLDDIQMLVIDEADIMFSYGYEQDLNELLNHLPQGHQTIMLSATMSDDIKSLRKKFLTDPLIMKVDETDLPAESQLSQFLIKCETDDKFLLLVAFLKLNLMRGKILIFVNDIERCYKVKLFLEQFAISSCVLNSELPQNSRLHIVEQFNKGLYDIVIATDEAIEIKETDDKVKSKPEKGKVRKQKKDKEYGVSRGIDFQDVENVLNFDFPRNPDSYIHRVGRTARGINEGTALSLVTIADELVLLEVNRKLSTPTETESVLKPYLFKMEEIEGFRYRVNDAIRSVTKTAIKEARLKEIKTEILTSKKLKSFFEDNPKDLKVLRHDKTLQPMKVQPHMKNVPDYLVPQTLRSNMSKSKRKPKSRDFGRTGKVTGMKRKNDDPLRTFKSERSKKKK